MWILILHKYTQLILEFPKDHFLVLHFSYYKLITFLMMLSAILLSMLMILLSILSGINYLIYGNKNNWFLNLNLTYKTTWTGTGSDLLI